MENPSTYAGELSNPALFSTSHWKMQDKVNVVNGIVEKADGTFMYGFQFSKIEESGQWLNLVVGSYPNTESEVDKIIKATRVTVIMSLLTDQEIR